jgi:hypothetical protein
MLDGIALPDAMLEPWSWALEAQAGQAGGLR